MVGIRSGRRTVAGKTFGFGAAVACAGALALAGQAGAATTAYPAGGSSFDGSAQDWAGSGTNCTLPLALVCEASNGYDPAVGNPPGSLSTNVNVLVGVGLIGVLSGGGTWTSPAFTVPTGEVVSGATFSYDRRFDAGGLVSIAPTSDVAVVLVDETTGTSAPLLADALTDADSTFATRQAPAAVVAGHTYRITLTTTMSGSLTVGLGGAAQTHFDNVSLAVTHAPSGNGNGDGGDGGAGGNGGNGGNSPGVTVVRGPYSDSEIASIISRFNINADSGNGRDGSLIPLELCTIVGTSGPDRINGTAGNDVICGLGGDDTITSSGGRDAIDGADGNDRLSGGIGDDLLLGLRGNDRLDGGGDDDRIGGGAGNDRIEAGNGADTASGGSGNDAVGGEAGNDTLGGMAGNDRINGGPGNDRLGGGAGNDVLRGFSGNDRLDGGSGNDRLDGGSGRDSFAAGSGADRILARDASRDTINGGPGRDRAVADRVDRISRVPVVSRR
jgi:Ca2+-binding RTX toxin-like protein